jgi:hypothetical protein
MFNENNKKYVIIGIVILLILIISLIVVFSKKSSEDEKKKDKENNYSIIYNQYNENELAQKMEFVYKNKKLDKINLTLYFSEEGVASLVADEYKSSEDFKDVKVKNNNVILTYKEKDMSEYEGLNKEDLKTQMEALGFVQEK